MFSGHPNTRNALYLQPPQTHAAVFCGCGRVGRKCLRIPIDKKLYENSANCQ